MGQNSGAIRALIPLHSLALATTLLLSSGCDAFFSSFVTPHPDNCVVTPDACTADEVCNQVSKRCEPRIDCRNMTLQCDNRQVCNQTTGACEAKPLPPRLPSLGGACMDSGVCWENPTPQGNDLYGVWGLSPTDLWMVGNIGTVLRYDGARWTKMTTGIQSDLRGVWGTSAADMWAVGNDGVILHWNGTSWKPATSNTTIALKSVWGTSPSNAWAVGNNGTRLRWNGTAWAIEASGVTDDLSAVFGTGPSDVWNTGTNGQLQHFDGAIWSKVNPGAGSTQLRGGSALDPQNVWVVGNSGESYRWVMPSWVRSVWPSKENLYGAVSPSLSSVLVAGGAGTLLWWNGSSWAGVPTNVSRDLRALWFDSVKSVWAVGQDGVVIQTTTTTPPTAATLSKGQLTTPIRSVWGSSGDNAWAVGDSGLILRRKASGWEQEPSNTTVRLNRVFGFAGGRVWAIGNSAAAGTSTFLERVGSTWTPIALTATTGAGADLDDMWGRDEHSTWLVGGGGFGSALILKYDAGTLTKQTIPAQVTQHLRGIWGVSPSYIWVVGDGGVALRFDGTAWTQVPTGTTQDLRSVWARSESEAWAVGANNVALFYNGTSWQPVPTATTGSPNIDKVHGFTDSGQVVAVGDAGTILRWSQGAWRTVPTVSDQALHSAFVLDEANCWTAGDRGTILNITP